VGFPFSSDIDMLYYKWLLTGAWGGGVGGGMVSSRGAVEVNVGSHRDEGGGGEGGRGGGGGRGEEAEAGKLKVDARRCSKKPRAAVVYLGICFLQ
jgi:hypothetical protein